MLTVVAMLLAVGVSLAQDGIAAVDIVNEGATMQQAASEANYEQVFFHASRILGAAGMELEGRSAEELWYIGLAHRYLMAQALNAAVDAGIGGDRAETAMKMAQEALCTYEDIREVSHGERVELTDYLVPGQTVIFDFFSQYCGPCVQLAPYVEKLAETRDDIVLVQVDINRPGVQGIDWQSPVAQQYGMRSIPHFKIYGPDGAKVAEGDQARNMIMGWLQQMEG